MGESKTMVRYIKKIIMENIEKLKDIQADNQVDYDIVDKINEIVTAVNHLQRLEILRRNLPQGVTLNSPTNK